VASRFVTQQPVLLSFLAHTNAAVRLLVSRLLGVIATAMAPDAASSLMQQLASKLPERGVSDLPKGVRYEEVHGSAAAAGFVCAAAQLAGVAEGSSVVKAMSECVQRFVGLLGNGDAQLAAAALAALGYIHLVAPLGLDKGDVAAVATDAKAGPQSASGMSPLLDVCCVRAALTSIVWFVSTGPPALPDVAKNLTCTC
jgi:hypothetical protein